LTGAKYLTEFTGLSTAQTGSEEAGIKLSNEQKLFEERKRLANLMLNPQALMTPQGTWDLDKIHEEVYKIAPMSGTDFIKSLTGLSTAQVENRKAALGLSLEEQKNKQRDALRDTLSKNPNQILTDGRIDPVKVNQLALKIAPDLSPDLISSLTSTATGQLQAGTSQIALNLEQQREIERKEFEAFTKNPQGLASFQTPSGLKLDELSNYVLRKYPLTGADLMAKISTLESANVTAQRAAQELSQDQRSIVAQTLGVLGRAGVNDKNSYIQALTELEKQNPNNPRLKTLLDAYKTTVNNLPSETKLSEIAIRASNSLLSPQQQQAEFAPKVGTAESGAGTFVTTTRPDVSGAAPKVDISAAPILPASLPPNSRVVYRGLDLNNNPIYDAFDASGKPVGQFTVTGTPSAAELPGGGGGGGNVPAPVPAPAPAPAPPPSPAPRSQNAPQAVVRLRPGETPETMTAANNIRLNASNAAREVPLQTFNNNQIIKLADDVITGRGANFIGALSGGYAGLPFTSDNATNLNQLGHYMALQTASLAASSGLGGTDAARGIAGQISGTTDWTAPAIKQTARVNRALATATKLFNDGIQKEFNKTNDPFSARDFQNKWSQKVDINAMRLYDAMVNKDNEGIAEIEKQFGGRGSAKLKDLIRKTVELQKFIRGQ
jgi:hypothetical protein